MWFALAVRTVLAAIKEATKDKKKKIQLRVSLLEIRNAIDELYPPQQ